MRCALETLVGGPEFAVERFCQGQVDGIVDGTLIELDGEFNRSWVERKGVMKLDPG